jgi:hypothetical protein
MLLHRLCGAKRRSVSVDFMSTRPLGLRRLHWSKKASSLRFAFVDWSAPRKKLGCYWIMGTMVEAIICHVGGNDFISFWSSVFVVTSFSQPATRPRALHPAGSGQSGRHFVDETHERTVGRAVQKRFRDPRCGPVGSPLSSGCGASRVL